MNDEDYMRIAADAARPWMALPNPRVGCVLVKDDVIVGVGAHEFAGGPHAEINALRAAGEAALGATAYVTLEPCKHFGRTGPCTQALIEAGVRRVVIAVADPTATAGGGAAALQAAGIGVEFGVGAALGEAVAEHWLHSVRTGRPFVTLKLATSLDGRVAAAAGVETAVSGPESRARVHALRATVDAILVGTETAEIDDPQLTVREAPAQFQPKRFVMGLRQLPTSLALLQGETRAIQIRTHDPVAALAQLHAREIRHVLIEGGPTIARAFLELGLVDEVVWITAPRCFGTGPLALGATGMEQVHAWRRIETVEVGQDLWSVMRPLPLP